MTDATTPPPGPIAAAEPRARWYRRRPEAWATPGFRTLARAWVFSNIADSALFAYTDVAADGGIDLQPFVEVRAWLQRVREQPRFVAMPAVTPEVRARLDARG